MLTLTACVGDPDDAGEDGASPGSINSGIGEVASLFVPEVGESEGGELISLVYDGLVYYTADGESELALAESISSEDNVTWTIQIKEGRTFQNGEPVTAQSFIQSWNHTAYGANAADLNYFMARIAGYDEMQGAQLPEEDWADPETPEYETPEADTLTGLTEIDELTFQVELNAPFAGFPVMLGYTAFFPVSDECMADIETCRWNPIGTGPYMLEEPWDVETGGSLVTWEDYDGEFSGSADRIDYRTYIGDDASCWADFQTGEIDVCSPLAADFEAALNDPDLNERLVQEPGTSFTYLGFPLYDETFENVDLRRALSLAVDREGLVTVMGEGRLVPADGWVPSTVQGGGSGVCEYCEYDPDRAEELLEEAGGWPEGEVLRIWYNTSGDNETLFQAVGNSIQQTLGIDYELVGLDWGDYLSTTSDHGVDGPFRLGWIPDYNLNENYLAPIYGGQATDNRFGYGSEAFNEAIAAADAAESVEEAVELYVEAERVLNAEFPNIPLTFSAVNIFYSERVGNVQYHPFYGDGADLRTIELVG